ncbi:uncharacterized protein BT62DRAFT_797829 [Guyanagaster necrorhizus]|uniref:Uncharacterized protein n=1 Tax=Guyanagaster necrorhizus TaxID=856835 RepID=A0A9P7VEN1_9AGAR|nr:uncharacterized protein BT62DRAFT_797829 [Guyanagaster necrorhizus MCA 3950]KAG7439167.1 hypothetical protein BT62DRAFT_797829 [Guyanagaster necrorhizus MCA 3950]
MRSLSRYLPQHAPFSALLSSVLPDDYSHASGPASETLPGAFQRTLTSRRANNRLRSYEATSCLKLEGTTNDMQERHSDMSKQRPLMPC